MSLFWILYNVIIKAGILFFVFIAGFNYVKRHKLNTVNYFLLYLLHYSFTFLAWFFALNARTDSVYYFKKATEASGWLSSFGLSSKMISFIIYPLIHFFKFDFLTLFLTFSTFSFFGFLIFYKLINNLEFSYKNKILGVSTLNIILFLPSFHFWVVMLGKDSLIFFLFIVFIDKANQWQTNKIKLFFILLFILLVRPYIVILLLGSFSICFLLTSLSSFKRLLIFVVLSVVLFFVTTKVFESMNMDINSFFLKRLNSVVKYSSRREGTGAFLDPSQYNSISKALMYLFNPNIFTATSIGQFYIAIENSIIFVICIKLIKNFSFRYLKNHFFIAVLIVYCIVFLFVKSYLLYNLGIANRQKFMILPSLFFIMFTFYNYNQIRKSTKKKYV